MPAPSIPRRGSRRSGPSAIPVGPSRLVGATASLAVATTPPCGNLGMETYLGAVLRLAILAVLIILVLGFARIWVEYSVEQRRRRRLAQTQDIRGLTPSLFEQYVGILLERSGYRVRRTGGSGDRGIDLLARRDGVTYVVQCKRYEETVGPSTVRELIGAMTNAGIRRGFLVTTSGFSSGARLAARKAPYKIDLVDGRRLVHWARAHGLPAEVMDLGPVEESRARGKEV